MAGTLVGQSASVAKRRIIAAEVCDLRGLRKSVLDLANTCVKYHLTQRRVSLYFTHNQELQKQGASPILAQIGRLADSPDWVRRIGMLLDALDAAKRPDQLDFVGSGFHALKGDKAGRYAVTVSRNWRVTFGWDGENAIDVDLEDYHD